MASIVSKLPQRARRFAVEVLFGVIVLIVSCAVLEATVRATYIVRNAFVDSIVLQYGIDADYGPIPPWIDDQRILKMTSDIMWRGRPNLSRDYVDIFGPAQSQSTRAAPLRRFWPRDPDSGDVVNQWQISLNGEGFRDEDFLRPKPPGRIRIMALGDSWTFGANVGQDQTYPILLEEALAKTYPDAEIEVLNLGVLGYSSYNVLKLFREVPDLDPDLVIIGVAVNEMKANGLRWADENRKEDKKKEPRLGFWQRFDKQSADLIAWIEKEVEFYRLLKYWAVLINWQPPPMDKHFRRKRELLAWEATMGGDEPWMREAIDASTRTIRELVEEVRGRGAEVILLYPEFWEDGPFVRTLRPLAFEMQFPLVDASVLLAEVRRDLENELEAKLELEPNPPNNQIGTDDSLQVLFRVYAEDVADSMYIVGPHDELGALCPNTVRMHDDGRNGDQKAGDKVWSYLARFPKSETDVLYVYTNSGRPCVWEGLDVPYIRSRTLPDSALNDVAYAPIDTFGRVYMHADPWHTNAHGYALIAQALLNEIRALELLQTPVSTYTMP